MQVGHHGAILWDDAWFNVQFFTSPIITRTHESARHILLMTRGPVSIHSLPGPADRVH